MASAKRLKTTNPRRSELIKSELDDEGMDPMLRELNWMRMHVKEWPQISADSDLVEVIRKFLKFIFAILALLRHYCVAPTVLHSL
jgi:hypothetical protein